MEWASLDNLGNPSQGSFLEQSDCNAFSYRDLISEYRNLDLGASPEIVERLRGELELLRNVNGETHGQEAIQSMISWLEEQPGASTAIVSVLRTGQDAFAFGRFAPGPNGFLKSYPTFRVALLDVLEIIAPEKALTVCKEILDTSENSDEWALSLRILVRHASSNEDQVILENKVRDLLNKGEWLSNPTFSYLHAFDVAVAGGEEDSLSRLGELVQYPPNRSVNHAAILSVDRFFQSNDLVGAKHILRDPGFLDSKTGFRATLMARLDPKNPEGVSVIESYLESDFASSLEKEVFLESFPNFNSTFSFNLVTESVILTRPEMRERSIASKDVLSRWLSTNAYPELNDKIRARLNWLAKTWRL